MCGIMMSVRINLILSRCLAKDGHRFRSIRCQDYLVALFAQGAAGRIADMRFIVNHENHLSAGRPARGRVAVAAVSRLGVLL